MCYLAVKIDFETFSLDAERCSLHFDKIFECEEKRLCLLLNDVIEDARV